MNREQQPRYSNRMRIQHTISMAIVFSVFAASQPVWADSARYTNDVRAFLQSRLGLQKTLQYMDTRPDLFPQKKATDSQDVNRQQRLTIWQTWQSFLDYMLTVDSLGQFYASSSAEDDQDPAQQKRHFKLAYAAFLANYRYALDFISRSENNPALHVVLNEPVTEIGLPRGTYSQLKLRYLNIIRGGQFAVLATRDQFLGLTEDKSLQDAIDSDKEQIWLAVKQGRAPYLTALNGAQIIADGVFTVWFPVQKGVSEWMGDVKVLRTGRSLISDKQIEALKPRLQPGDILLERREWYLSNIGLPGYWPHAALYIGTEEQRRDYFNDPAVKQWVAQQNAAIPDLNGLLKHKYPQAYELSQQPQEQAHQVRLLEAISEGVSFTTLEHSASADALVVLRPRLSKKEKAVALVRAFHFSGRPYDFNFDFLTDASLVCTELIYKAYEPGEGIDKGLRLPLVDILGRKATPANEIARQFDETYATAQQQFDFVLFLDGHESSNKAVESSLAEFRASWRRPKWHILTQKEQP